MADVKCTVVTTVSKDGKTYEPGEAILLEKAEFEKLRSLGSVKNYDPPPVPPPVVSLPKIRVTAPNGGEHWSVGSNHKIQWAGSDTEKGGVVSVEILLDRNNDGVFEEPIANVPGNPDGFVWTVTSPAVPKARIRVTAKNAAGDTASDDSNGTFAIV